MLQNNGVITGSRFPKDDTLVVDNGILGCPDAPERVTVRNLGYGYNYQFLGNARPKHFDERNDPNNLNLAGLRWANFPVSMGHVSVPHRTVAFADTMGSAGELPSRDRLIPSCTRRAMESEAKRSALSLDSKENPRGQATFQATVGGCRSRTASGKRRHPGGTESVGAVPGGVYDD